MEQYPSMEGSLQPAPSHSGMPQPDLFQETLPESISPRSGVQPLSNNQSGLPQTDPSQSGSSNPDQTNSDQSGSGALERRSPRPGRRNSPQYGIYIQNIPYKTDRRNRERLVRPGIEYVFPTGHIRREDLNNELTYYMQVQMEPDLERNVWMSRYPINFTSPHGLVTPIGQPPAQHILFWWPEREPRRVMPHLICTSRGQAFADQALPTFGPQDHVIPQVPFQAHRLPQQSLPSHPVPGQCFDVQAPAFEPHLGQNQLAPGSDHTHDIGELALTGFTPSLMQDELEVLDPNSFGMANNELIPGGMSSSDWSEL